MGLRASVTVAFLAELGANDKLRFDSFLISTRLQPGGRVGGSGSTALAVLHGLQTAKAVVGVWSLDSPG